MSEATMPALFLAHGSPMNAIEDNPFSALWQRLGRELPRPKAIVVISAHWCTQGLWATAMAQPRTLHDFGGFPPALSALRYPAPGSPALARELQSLLAPQYTLSLDEGGWGLDHGAWSLLVHLYPQADIPVIQLSLDPRQPAAYHYQLGQALAPLRQRGILMLGSGNVVHNLRTLRWEAEAEPYPWARRFEDVVRQGLRERGEDAALLRFADNPDATLANPTPEHFLPLLPVLGCWDGAEPLRVFEQGIVMGSLSMLSLQVG
ncbi:4,5-DOPA dioxygenase extradiol [Edwardsiella piscicida]|uniref:4,5-DOPA-extradiol-dioxygenase n=1 Tax=Edwardsiella piscicida TaxID=1263550 RepID=UPI0009350F7E|nr:4,5-DOPA dioxygenase extradiol [Edwardsiella piscicida]EKS7813597.1 4,5-DOPA dioxygenase extradiol [Edwardsiella piscicida]UCQ21553.1 4,5-DOPA dioxygenase extradiol [Edwardsiella piscicida]WAM45175.1 4,5-DOPA dioxygenase extradiol [Edwardsiella piscicida]